MSFSKHISIFSLVMFLFLQMSCTETSAQSRKQNVPNEIDKIDTLNLENKQPENRHTEKKIAQNTKSYNNYEDFEFKTQKVHNSSEKEHYYQKGMASWYGRAFHGKTTASGEKFNMYKYTVAHKTIPFGSIVEITNLKNGKKVRAKVNDRGPYKGKRILDMSYGAARELDLLAQGTGPVGIKILQRGGSIAADKKSSNVDSTATTHKIEPVISNLDGNNTNSMTDNTYIEKNNVSAGYTLQAGAFYSQVNAHKMKEKLQEMVNGKVVIVRENQMYKVRIKGIPSQIETKKIKQNLIYRDIKTFVVENKE